MIEMTENGRIVATAIHAGHQLREEVRELCALDDQARLREEDPYTDAWTEVGDIRITREVSRFETDVNRPLEKAVYIKPEDAWGLQLWKHDPPGDMIERSLAGYDAFYKEVEEIFRELEERVGRFVVLDLHSYNHIRPTPDSPPADPEKNPEVIVGTSNMNRAKWAPVVDRLIEDLRSFDFSGRRLDVRENVKWSGGHFSQWIHNTFPRSGCSFAIEFKKFFMDEWSGELFPREHQSILEALRSCLPGLRETLDRMQ